MALQTLVDEIKNKKIGVEAPKLSYSNSTQTTSSTGTSDVLKSAFNKIKALGPSARRFLLPKKEEILADIQQERKQSVLPSEELFKEIDKRGGGFTMPKIKPGERTLAEYMKAPSIGIPDFAGVTKNVSNKLFRTIAKETDALKIAERLKNEVPQLAEPDVLKRISPKLAQTTDENEVQKIIDIAIKSQPKVPPYDVAKNTLPIDIHITDEAKAIGAKRIAPDRIAHQQLTPDAGIEKLVEKAKQTATKNAESWNKAVSGLDEMIKKYDGKVPPRGTDDFFKYSGYKKYASLARNPIEMRDEFIQSSKRVAWNPTKETAYRTKVADEYKALVKADISKGYKYPPEVLDYDTSFTKAINDRARYEKGLATSFSADDARIVMDEYENIGAGVKRQDGKNIEPKQLKEITDGVTDFSAVTGLDMKKIAQKERWVYVHLNGKNPFLMKQTAGLYRKTSDSVSISLGGKETFEHVVDGKVVKESVNTTISHEIGHALDHQTENKLFDSAFIYERSKDYNPVEYGYRGAKYWSSKSEVTARMIEEYTAVEKGHTALYDRDGYWKKSIYESKIKPAITEAFNKHFSEFKVNKAQEVKQLFAPEKPQALQQAEAEVITEMQDLSQAGYRFRTPDFETKGVASTFPKWIPENLRSKNLFDSTIKHYEAGTTPTGNKQKELLDVIKQEVETRTGKYEEINYYEDMARGSDMRQESQEILVGKSQENIAPELPTPEIMKLVSSLDESIPKIESIVNLDTLNISPTAKKFIQDTVEDVAPMIEEKIGKTLSNKEALDYANRTSEVLTRTIGREKTMEWEAAMLNTREKLARLAESGVVDKEYIDTLLTVKTLGADLGRKLQSLSIKAQPSEATAIENILEEVLKVADNADEVLRQAEGVDFNDFKQASEFYRKFIKPTASDWVDLVRYNSMLSSPLTHIVNIYSNLVNSALIGTLEKLTTGSIDAITSTVTGRGRSQFAGEAGVFLKEYASAISEATSRFSKALKGDVQISNLDTRNIPLTKEGTVARAVETSLSIPMRLLEASDQFFTALTEAGEKGALTYRQSKGVKVRAPIVKAQQQAQYRLYRQELFAEGQGVVLDAVDRVTAMLYQARNSENPIVSNILKFTVPFLRTPTNIFKQGLEYSPTGFFTLIGASDKQTQLSKALIGSSIFAGSAMLLNSGRITWAEPVSEKERNAFREAGMLPYSVKIGDTWVQYQKMPPPIAFPLSMVSLIDSARKERKIDETVAEMILSSIAKYGDFLADQSYAKSIGDLLSAFQGGESDWARVIGNVPQQLVPYRALGGWLSRLIDDVQRKPDPDGTFIEKQVQLLMMNIPGLTGNVPARTTPSGEEIKSPNNVINAFSPLRTSSPTQEQEQGYKNFSTIKKLEQKATQEHSILNDQAEQTEAELKLLPAETAKQRLKEIAKQNPELAKKIVSNMKDEALGLSDEEKQLKNATVSTRVQFIKQKLEDMNTKEEKKTLLKEYAKKKILTEEAMKELVKSFQ